MRPLRMATLRPGHFHAALVQKEEYPDVARDVTVHAPLEPDLLAHLARVTAFNARAERPTGWRLDLHAGDDWLERFFETATADFVVLAGRNRRKIELIARCLDAGMHVLADKPWIVRAEDHPRLRSALALAERRGLVAYDIMTERHEITSILQGELVADREIFGDPVPGTPADPGVTLESVHFLKKLVSGVPLRRPAWFFDLSEQGDALEDVGVHLVDLVQNLLFPNDVLALRDAGIHAYDRWPTEVSRTAFRDITGEADFPAWASGHVRGEALACECNSRIVYSLRGIWVKLDVLWGLESQAGGDTHFAQVRGTRARIEVRQGAAERFRPEVYVVPEADVSAALAQRVAEWQTRWPGVSLAPADEAMRLEIPDRYRVSHEAHFAAVTRCFLAHLRGVPLPPRENPNLIVKYATSTRRNHAAT